MKYLILSFLLIFLSFPVHSQCEDQRGLVTLLQVLSNPQKYHGQELQLIGFLHIEFEGDGLYLHKEDFDHGIVGNMIWVHVTEEMNKKKDKLNDRYVIIRGVFDANDHGHMGLFSGALKKITRCDAWPDRETIRRQINSEPIAPPDRR
jgi:hypothetical protein